MSKINSILDKIAEEVGDDYLSGTIFDPTTGLGVVNIERDKGFDTDTLNAYISEYLMEVQKTLTSMKVPPRVVEYMLTAKEGFIILIRGITGTKYFQSCVIKKEGNLGLAKEILRKNEPSLVEELKKL